MNPGSLILAFAAFGILLAGAASCVDTTVADRAKSCHDQGGAFVQKYGSEGSWTCIRREPL
jgi:hypothetical protein